jgi:polyhydroxybutyrate depolymerase
MKTHRPLLATVALTLVALLVLGSPARAARNKRRERLRSTTTTTKPVTTTTKPAATKPNPTTKPNSTNQVPARTDNISLSVGGRARTARLTVPAHATTDVLALVIVLHGGGGSGDKMAGYTGFDQVARVNGFAVAFPDGIDSNWNDGRANDVSTAAKENIDDVAFIRALIDSSVSKGNIDRGRVFVTGMSNGAMMSIRLACEAADLFAGVAAVSGTGPVGLEQRCRPSTSIPLLQIHGTADPLAPYGGGTITTGGQNRGDVISVDALADFFAMTNRCGTTPAVGSLPDTDRGDGSTITTRTWSGCNANAPVVFWKVEGGGHTWPGERKSLPRFLVGSTNNDVDATAEIWKFFASLPPRR